MDLGIIQEVLDAGIRLPPGVERPHNYQIEDLNTRGRAKSCGYFLDIGLGKTLMGAMSAGWNLLHGFDRAYVLCPASLTQQWYEVASYMGFDTLLYAGTPKDRKKFNFDHDIIILSFEIFQKDYDTIKSFPGYFVVDEATILSNPNNKFYKMLNGGILKKDIIVPGRMLPKKEVIQFPQLNDGCCLLTATPSNNPADLYGLIKTIDPDIYTNEFQFNRLHVSEENIFGAPTKFMNLDMLKENLRSVASIRFATDYLDLPPVVYNLIEYDLDPEHYKIYKELLEKKMLVHDGKIVIDALQVMAYYNWAQKIIVNPDKAMYKKDPKVLSLLDTIVENNPQTLIVNKYVMSNDKMMLRYKKLGIGGCYGSISRTQQIKYIQAFKDRKLRVLTINEKSGGVGLNLQVCSSAVYPEMPVTARGFRQSVGRIYRQGQKERVIITLFVARKTIQKTLLKLIMARDDVMQEVLCSPKSLREDLFPVD